MNALLAIVSWKVARENACQFHRGFFACDETVCPDDRDSHFACPPVYPIWVCVILSDRRQIVCQLFVCRDGGRPPTRPCGCV